VNGEKNHSSLKGVEKRGAGTRGVLLTTERRRERKPMNCMPKGVARTGCGVPRRWVKRETTRTFSKSRKEVMVVRERQGKRFHHWGGARKAKKFSRRQNDCEVKSAENRGGKK